MWRIFVRGVRFVGGSSARRRRRGASIAKAADRKKRRSAGAWRFHCCHPPSCLFSSHSSQLPIFMKRLRFLSGRPCEKAWNATNVDDGPPKSQSPVSISLNNANLASNKFEGRGALWVRSRLHALWPLNYSYFDFGIHFMALITSFDTYSIDQ